MKTINVKNGYRFDTSKRGDRISFELKNGEELIVTQVYYRAMNYRVISSIVENEDVDDTVRIFKDSVYDIYYVGHGMNTFQINELIVFDKLNDALDYIG